MGRGWNSLFSPLIIPPVPVDISRQHTALLPPPDPFALLHTAVTAVIIPHNPYSHRFSALFTPPPPQS